MSQVRYFTTYMKKTIEVYVPVRVSTGQTAFAFGEPSRRKKDCLRKDLYKFNGIKVVKATLSYEI